MIGENNAKAVACPFQSCWTAVLYRFSVTQSGLNVIFCQLTNEKRY